MMHVSKKSALILSLLLSAIFLAIPCVTGKAWAANQPALTNADCGKCHSEQAIEVAAAGGAHRSQVTCLDCHGGHRPLTSAIIPPCSDCHEGTVHYGLKECLSCHQSAHSPLKVTLSNKLTDPCLTCHPEEIIKFKEYKSKHSTLFCTACHSNHKDIPSCVGCHNFHSDDMAEADCKECHRAHTASVVTSSDKVPNTHCGTCHQEAFGLLGATATKHASIRCVTCHKGQHQMIPECQGCHTTKHPIGILNKFSTCGDCHFMAHDLNNWPVSRKKSRK